MHHFIYCEKDTFLYNEEIARYKNFGLDPFLEVGAISKFSRTYKVSSSISTSGSNDLINSHVSNFNGNFTGSLCGIASSITGSVVCGLATCLSVFISDDNGNYILDDQSNFIYISEEDLQIFPS
jgi:hypothetical protein